MVFTTIPRINSAAVVFYDTLRRGTVAVFFSPNHRAHSTESIDADWCCFISAEEGRSRLAAVGPLTRQRGDGDGEKRVSSVGVAAKE